MSFSPRVFANIKHAKDSEGEEAEQEYNENLLLTALTTFPETATDSLVEILPAGENLKQEAFDVCVDPLLGNGMVLIPQNCLGNAYQDSDVLKSDESDDDNAPLRPNKRLRLQSELKSLNGHTWKTNKNDILANKSFDSALQSLQPKCKGPAQTINNMLEIWSLLLDEQIIGQIVTCTNVAIKKQKFKTSGPRLIDAVELRAWIGLNYLCGIFRNAVHNGPLDELWSLELGNAIFRATMPLKRFEFILENLRFGEANSNESTEELYVVPNVWNKFLINCRSYYAPSGNCCVDEICMNFNRAKEKSPRLLIMCDVKTLYMCNGAFCKNEGYGERDVLRIVSDIKGTKRNVVLQPQLTSIDLAYKLGKIELSMIGIVPKVAKEIPPAFLASTTIDKLYAETVALSKSKKNLGILLHSRSLDKRIHIEHLYSLSCSACQNYRTSTALYSTIHATQPAENSWPVYFFQNILDYAIVNSWILFSLSTNGDSSMKQRDFQRHLGLYLTQQQLKRQLQSGRLALPQKVQISEVLGEPTDELFAKATEKTTKIKIDYIPIEKLKLPDSVKILPKNLQNRLRCRKCPSRKTKTRCQQCLTPLCQKHFVQRCRDCTGLRDLDAEKDTEEADHTNMSDSDGDLE
ncbi:uncharacterized protein [Eurosta solidaginis]|uniref:uncharacterized protein n=1 Tax=Eurosta solidaginis TaxID=178769 RepID=UPI0035312584